ncbi:MAG: hypothetical protein HPY62_14040, partial [Bacteroidales bacterium]|nr:hypothetical protein [Bacteroidales bacterium]
MIDMNPDDSVRKEPDGADDNAAGTQENITPEKPENEDITPEKAISDLIDQETTAEKVDATEPKTPGSAVSESELQDAGTPAEVPAPKVKIRKKTPDKEDSAEKIPHEAENGGLPPVDYSGYSKQELIDTLELIIDNRPASEIKDDVERIKTCFYKKSRL